MKGYVQILDVTPGIFRDKITVLALGDCSKVYGSFLGERRFRLPAGRRKRIGVGKKLYTTGETVPFEEVCTPNNAFDFAWSWE